VKTWKHKIELDARGLAPDVAAGQLADRLGALPDGFRARQHGTTELDDIIGWLTDAKDGIGVVADDAEDKLPRKRPRVVRLHRRASLTE
jgi:hypothetical protein